MESYFGRTWKGKNDMLCCKQKCMIAMDPENRKHTSYVGRTWDFDLLEGEMEGWVCPTCGVHRVTEMRAGVRENAMLLPVIDEVEE